MFFSEPSLFKLLFKGYLSKLLHKNKVLPVCKTNKQTNNDSDQQRNPTHQSGIQWKINNILEVGDWSVQLGDSVIQNELENLIRYHPFSRVAIVENS